MEAVGDRELTEDGDYWWGEMDPNDPIPHRLPNKVEPIIPDNIGLKILRRTWWRPVGMHHDEVLVHTTIKQKQ